MDAHESAIRVAFFGDNADRHPLDSFVPVLGAFLTPDAGFHVDFITDKTLFTDYVDKSGKPFEPLTAYDVLVVFHPSLRTLWTWNTDQMERIEAFVAGGNGLVALHSTLAMLEEDPHHQRVARLVGGHIIEHGPLVEGVEVSFSEIEHPIAPSIPEFSLYDEPYKVRPYEDVHVLATVSHSSIGASPAVWTRTGGGRVCYISTGHSPRAYANEQQQALLANAISWTAGG